MADPTWDDTEEIIPKFEDTEEVSYDDTEEESPEFEPDVPSMLATIGRSGLSGASSGFSEEIGAGITAIPDWISEKMRASEEKEGLGKIQTELVDTLTSKYHKAVQSGDTEKADKIQKMIEKETAMPFKAEEAADFGDIYRERRDLGREATKAGEEAHPSIALASEIAGGIAPAIATGGASAVGTLAKTGIIAAAKPLAASGAKWGAAEALGRTEADLTKGEIGEAAKDVALGTTVGAVASPLIGTAGSLLMKGANKLTVKMGEKARNKAIATIKELDDLSGELGLISKEAAKATRAGQKIASKSDLAKSSKAIETKVKEIIDHISLKTTKVRDQKFKHALDADDALTLTDTFENIIQRNKKTLKGLEFDSDDAKAIRNVNAGLEEQQRQAIKRAGYDPDLPNKTQAMNKLKKIHEDLTYKFDQTNFEAKATNRLFNIIAKMKGNVEPDKISQEWVSKTFDIPEESAVDMLKQVISAEVKVPVILKQLDPKTKKIIETKKVVSKELRQVIDKFRPEIVETAERLHITRGAGDVSNIQKFIPDTIKTDVQMKPQELQNLIADVGEKTYGKGGLASKIGKSTSEELKTTLKKGIGETKANILEEGLKLGRTMHDLDKLIPGIKQSRDSMDTAMVVEKLQDFVQKEMTGLNPGQKNAVLDQFKKDVKILMPEIAEDTLETLGKLSKLKELQEIAHKAGAIRVTGTVETLGARGGALVGKGMRAVDNAFNNIPSSTLAQFSPQAHKISPKLGNFIDSISKVTDGQKKHALIFAAMQNPDFRGYANKLFGFDKDLDKKEE